MLVTAVSLSGCAMLGPLVQLLPFDNVPAPAPSRIAPSVDPTTGIPEPTTTSTDPDPEPTSPEPTESSPQPTRTVTSPSSTGNYYGAIAVNVKTAAYGWANNYKSKSAAEKAAMANCRKYPSGSNCQIKMWVRNACAAIAWRTWSDGRFRWGTSWATTKAKAEAQAKKLVGSGAKTRTAFCTANA